MDGRDAFLDRIGELVERGAFRQALEACERALAEWPSCAEAHDFHGLILSRMGRHPEALAAYDRALAVAPELIPALLDKAELLVYHLHHDEDAVPVADRVLRLKAPDVDLAHAHYLKGVAFANMDHHELALPNYDLALALDAESSDAHCERGVSAYELYRFGEALRALKTAAGLDPAYARPRHYLGCIYEFTGEDGLAEREFVAAATLDAEAYPEPLRLDDADFQAAVQEAVHTLPREVSRLLPDIDLRCRRLPDRRLLADGHVRPSTLTFHGQRAATGRRPLTLFQRNLERLVRSRAELVEEIAHAIAHDLGHPEHAA